MAVLFIFKPFNLFIHEFLKFIYLLLQVKVQLSQRLSSGRMFLLTAVQCSLLIGRRLHSDWPFYTGLRQSIQSAHCFLPVGLHQHGGFLSLRRGKKQLMCKYQVCMNQRVYQLFEVVEGLMFFCTERNKKCRVTEVKSSSGKGTQRRFLAGTVTCSCQHAASC